MKRILRSFIITLILTVSLPVQTLAAELLIPVGQVIGLQLRDETLTVAAYDDLLGSCARDAGLQIGDQLLKVDSTPVSDAVSVRAALSAAGTPVSLTVRRSGKLTTLRITPRQTQDGPRLGIYLRQGIAGIGTVTFYDPATGLFGTLGHGVSDSKGNLLTMHTGSAFDARVLSVKKGKAGQPGQLKGDAGAVLGPLLKNTPQGVFGKTETPFRGEALPTAAYSQIKTGPASIRSTVEGRQVQEYSVEILKIYPQDRSDGRNFLLRVTDPALLQATGGIVQGMSGSPIIQDGKLVGAVTHVLVNDPTRGYGIFIENMLDAAG